MLANPVNIRRLTFNRRYAVCVLAFAAALISVSSPAEAVVVTSTPQANSATEPNDPNAPPEGGLTLQGILGETATYQSNPLMTVQSSKALFGSTTSPELLLKDQSDMARFAFDGKVDENLFNQSLFNSTDVHANSNLSLQNERWTAAISQGTNYDTTRTSELTNFNFGQIVSRHLGLSLAPSIGYQATPLDSFNVQGEAQTSTYQSTVFTNYETFSVTPTYSHKIDPLNTAFINLLAQRYQTTRGQSQAVNSIGPSIGWQSNLSQQLSVSGSIGAEAVRQFQLGAPVDPWTWETIFSAGLSYTGEQDTVGFDASRAQDPYGNGSEALQTTLTATETHKLSHLISLNAQANYLKSSYQQTFAGNLDSELGGMAGATLHLTEYADLTASYQYEYESLSDTSTHPQNNSVFVSLTLRPNGWTLMH